MKGFYKLSRSERFDALREFSGIPVDQMRTLLKDGSLSFEAIDLFVENALGSYPLPLGVATSFKINTQDYLIPMAVEESSVIAAASNAAKSVYQTGGFQAENISNLMIGQIQILDIEKSDFEKVENTIFKNKEILFQKAAQIHPRLIQRGGGLKDIEIKSFENYETPFMVLHLLVDTGEAMGANLINTLCEGLAPYIEELIGHRIGLKILSNLADRRLFKAQCRVHASFFRNKVKSSTISDQVLCKRMIEAWAFADADPYRATTHNKGIMNGIDPVVIATGNDWRAIEAGAHAYAAKDGRYRSLSKWSLQEDNYVHGELTIPLQLGTVGGVTRLHPSAQLALKILKNPSTLELGKIIACSGLASNLAAMRALTTTGIQRGHMKLHAKNIAFAAGAQQHEIDIVAKLLVEKSDITASTAEIILKEIREREILTQNGPSLSP